MGFFSVFSNHRNKLDFPSHAQRYVGFYVLLTVHLGTILADNELEAQFFFIYVYFYSLHVSDSYVPIIRRINCINTTSGICHSVQMIFWYVGLDGTVVSSKPAYFRFSVRLQASGTYLQDVPVYTNFIQILLSHLMWVCIWSLTMFYPIHSQG